MKINKKITITILAIITVVSAIIFYKFLPLDSEIESDDIVATYKNGSVTLNEAQVELDKLSVQSPELGGLAFADLNIKQQKIIINEVVLKEVAAQQARKQKLHKSAKHAQSLRILEDELLKQQLFAQIIAEVQSEENLKANYEKSVQELATKQDIKIGYIALATKKKAQSVHKILLKYPQSFARQAKKKSIDKTSAKKGGDLDFILEDSLPPEIASRVKNLEKGQISEVFKLAEKWVIIKLKDTRPAEAASFENAKESLKQSLSMKALQEFIAKSLKESEVNIVN